MLRRFIFLLSAFLISFTATVSVKAQGFYVIKGKVVDGNTGEPLLAASVFAQNTTVGNTTDSAGNFRIKLPEGGYTLAVTYSGYETQNIRINHNTSNEDLIVHLVPAEQSLDEVAIVLDMEVKDGWEKYGQFFLDNFIGQTQYSKGCIIKNHQALHFYFYKKRNTLKVIAKEPIIVENFALGYTLKFNIDSFTNNYNTRTTLFVGYPLFEEMEGSLAQRNMWLKNRFSIYNGSVLHFMRSLYAKKLSEEGFELKFIIKTPTEEVPITFKDPYAALNFTEDLSGVVQIQPTQQEVAVIYHRERPEVNYLILDPTSNKNFQISTLIFEPGQATSVEQNGYYYPQEEMITNGYFGFKKIADMLPYDYQPLTIIDDSKPQVKQDEQF